jgi:hypothetical protein
MRTTRWKVATAAAAALAVMLAGCGREEPPALIVLQHPQTGDIVPCGPPPGAPSANPAAEAQRCAATYEKLGYRRLPAEVPSD